MLQERCVCSVCTPQFVVLQTESNLSGPPYSDTFFLRQRLKCIALTPSAALGAGIDDPRQGIDVGSSISRSDTTGIDLGSVDPAPDATGIDSGSDDPSTDNSGIDLGSDDPTTTPRTQIEFECEVVITASSFFQVPFILAS